MQSHFEWKSRQMTQEYISKSKFSANDIAKKLSNVSAGPTRAGPCTSGDTRAEETMTALSVLEDVPVEEEVHGDGDGGEVAKKEVITDHRALLKAVGSGAEANQKIYIFQNTTLNNTTFN